MMKRSFIFLIAVLTLLLTGCASTLRNEVNAFHQWPSDLTDKSFTFEMPPGMASDDSIEYGNYQKLVATELRRLGFTDPVLGTVPKLKVAMHYISVPYEIHYISPDPFWNDPFWYRPRWGRYGHFYGPYYGGRFYDPFWYGPPYYQEATEQRFRRQLHIAISQVADNKKLYEVTVTNNSSRADLSEVMPYMIKSAFADFPGKSGVPHRVDFKLPD